MYLSLIDNELLNNIALTLIHFLWQGLLIAIILKLVLVSISERKPHLKYLAASGAMLANIIAPIITFNVISQGDISTPLNNHPAVNSQLLNLPLFSNSQYALDNIQDYLPYISVAWLACIALLSLRLLVQMFQVNQLPKQGVKTHAEHIEQMFSALVQRLKLSQKPKLVVSLAVHVPMAIGWIKPIVMLPASMVSGLTNEQLEMLLLHELAHIKRHDYLVNLIQSLIEILLFFHPSVHWVSKQMRIEREYCSDDIAVKQCGDALAYAHTLADTASICNKHRHHAIPTMAMAATGGELKNRVIRLVNHHHCTSSLNKSKWLAAIIVSCSLILLSTQYLSSAFYSQDETTQKTVINIAQQPNTERFNNERLNRNRLSDNTSEKTNDFKTAIESNITFAGEKKTENTSLNTNPPALTASNFVESAEIESSLVLTSPAAQAIVKAEELNSSAIIQSIKKNKTPVTKVIQTKSTATASNKLIENEQLKNPRLIVKTKATKTLTKSKTVTAERVINTVNDKSIYTRASAAQTKNTTEPLTVQNIASFAPIEHQLTVLTPANTGAFNSELLGKKDVAREKKFKNAKAISVVDPKYPSRAQFQGVELDLLVNFSIDEDGKVKNIEVEKKHKSRYFRSEIVKALAQWKFEPAVKNGKPVATNMSKIFSFNLEAAS